jgi:peptidoglycan/LPS O-acetylase OafA/YrhL
MHPQYRPDIDGLRAIAILSVVVFHVFPDALPGGFIGVDVFFVISGFLISTIIFSSLEKDRFSLVEFYVRRIRRIFPALIVVMLVFLTIGWFILLADEYELLGKHIAGGAAFVSNFILWRESGYFDVIAETKPMLHLWSLAVEEQYYIFWPLLLAFVWKKKWSFVGTTTVIAVFSFLISIYLSSTNPTASFYSPFSRFWELMVGGILAYVVRHRPGLINRHNQAQSVLGFALLIAGLTLIDKESSFPGWLALLPTIGAFFSISAGPDTWLNRNLLSNRVMIWIGLISYPLYLWHWPILSFIRTADGEPTLETKFAAIAVAVLLSWATYRLVESPFRLGKSKGKKTLILLFTMTLVGAAGLVVNRQDGLENRPVNRVVNIEAYDYVSGYRQGQCFQPGAETDSFPDSCIGPAIGRKPTVLLWGDSQSASLYRGLRQQSTQRDFNLSQYTSSGCPPVLEFDVPARSQCRKLNAQTIEQIARYRPDTVLLAARWSNHFDTSSDSVERWGLLKNEDIEQTILKLKGYGIRNIFLVGDLPLFKTTHVRAGIREFMNNKKIRTFNQFNYESMAADDRLSQIARKLGVRFFSPIDTLCDEQGCLMSLSTKKLVPLAWDKHHLTEKGSVYLVQAALRNGSLELPSTQSSAR